MKALAAIAVQLGFSVTGSDLVTGGHDKNNITGKDLVVYSGAVPEDNEELAYAKKIGVPTMERSDFLAFVARQFDMCAAVAGCHGKTTVTAMTGETFAVRRPTVHLGGEYAFDFTPGLADGKKEVFITEACEYRRSFLKLRPDIAIITNIDFDHPDTYKDVRDVTAAFMAFVSCAGTVIYSGDDAICAKMMKRGISYGFSERCDYVVHPRANGFELTYRGHPAGEFFPRFSEPFNIKNAAAAIAAAYTAGIDYKDIKRGIERFCGVKRRGEIVLRTEKCVVVSDYSHHPAEISERIAALKRQYKKLAVIFQPHTYSRTKALAGRFATAFSAADKVIFTDTFAAREKTGDDKLIYRLSKDSCDCVFVDEKDLFEEFLRLTNSFDCVALMGAGDMQKKIVGRYRDAAVCHNENM